MSPLRWTTAIALAAIVAVVATTQLSVGAYGNDLASYPDEAAYFVSAVCLLDYLALAPGSDPMRFAQAYYAHFPKVAFGHWPPGFFVEQAGWYALFGASPSAGLLLIGITAVITGFLLFQTIRRFYDTWITAVAVAVFLMLPMVRLTTTMLLPDLTVSLFAFMAVRALADGCLQNRWRPWLACVSWSTALVLTKESGLVILLFAPAGFLLFGGAQRWSKRAAYFWGSLAVFCLATLAVYKGTGVLQMRGFPSMDTLPPFRTRITFLAALVHSTPLPVLVLAAVGAIAAIVMRQAPIDRRIQLRCHALWVALWVVAQIGFRDVIEDRYFLPAVPSMMVLFSAGLDRIDAAVQMLTRGFATRIRSRSAVTALAIGICCLAMMPSIPQARRRGYAAAIDAVAGAASPQAILVSSDAPGAGALIADLVARHRDGDVFAVRSDKVLAASDWMGNHFRLLASSTSEVLKVLDSIPIRYVVLDVHASILDADRTPHRLLRETVLTRRDRFRMIASLPIFIDGTRYGDALQVFENVAVPAASAGAIRLPSSALVLTDRPENAGEWVSRSPARVRRDIAIAAIIDGGADRLTGLLPLRHTSAWLPPVRPSSDRVGPAGAVGELLVAPNVPSSTIESSDPWIRISSGGSPRIVRYAVTENDSLGPRTGFIAIGPVRVPLSQEGRQ